MLSKDRSPIFLIVLAVFGMLFPTVTGPGASRRAVSTRATAAPDSPPADSASAESASAETSAQMCPGVLPDIPGCTDAFVGVLEDFFFPRAIDPPGAMAPLASNLATPTTNVSSATCAPRRSLPAMPRVRTIVATFADPFASGLRVFFDRSLDAVVRAIEARGYERDRYWSPWDGSTRGRKSAGGASPAPHCAEQLPGLFLFRAGAGAADKTPLMLLVVGETPTWGIHKRAFASALELIAARPGDTPPLDDPISVLGPTFSGSSASLRDVIVDWRDRHSDAKFDVVTGTASSPVNRLYFPNAAPGVPVRFRQAVVPDDILQQAFYRYLHDRWGLSSPCDDSPELALHGPCPLDHVAIMSELGTAYGQSFGATGAADRALPPDDARPGRIYAPELPLPFPLHIASVRTQYERTSAAPGSTTVAPPTALDPRLDDTTRRSDTPPLLSPSSPVTEDLMLSRTIDAISDRGIQLVGIAATDPADMIFLAQHVRQRRPDIRLFVFGGDLLFTHPDLVAATGGTLLVDPYSMTPALRWGFAAQPGAEAFPASAATGTYVAARTLLARESERPDRNLAVWVSAIGANGAWPLAAIMDPSKYAEAEVGTEPASADRAVPGAIESYPERMRPPSPPPEWTAIALGMLAFCAWATVGFCVALLAPEHVPRLLRPVCPVGCAGPLTLGKTCAMGVAIGAVDAMALPVAWSYFRRGPSLDAWDVSAWVLSSGVLLSFITVAGSAIAWTRVLRDVGEHWLHVVSFAVSAAGPPALLVVLLRHAGGAQFEGPLFILRVGAPASYLSPLAPLLLVLGLFYLAAFVQLEILGIRQAWSLGLDGRHDKPGAGWPEATPWDPGKACELASALSAWKVRSLASAGAVLIAWAVIFEVSPLWTFEGKEANALFYWLLAGAAVVVAVSFAWLVGVWRDLHTFLRRLNGHYDSTALKAAMRRLPDGLAAPAATRLAALPHEGDQADALARIASWLDTNRAAILGWPPVARFVAASTWAAGLEAGFAEVRTLGPKATADDRFAATFRARNGVLPILRAFWAEPAHRWPEPRQRALNNEGATATVGTVVDDPPERLDADAGAWLAKAEELVAGHAAICVHPVVSLLRLLLALAVGTALLWALAIGSYMFQPARLLTTIVSVTLIGILLTGFTLIIDLDCDETISALNKTAAKITWTTFLADALTWIILPFLAFLSMQYPAVANSVASWLEPATRLVQ